MEVIQIAIDTLIPYAMNARTHPDSQISKIAASIKEFGFNNPILIDKDNGIIAGHGRVLAAKKLGLVSVPCIMLEHLSEAQRKAYILADNRIALDGGWDHEMLSMEVKELNDLDFDIMTMGFDQSEITGMLGDFLPAKEEDQGDLGEKKLTECPNCGEKF